MDELDFVKTDGGHIYLAQGQKLYVVKSWPPKDSEEIASITLRSTSLFVREPPGVMTTR